MTLISVLPSYNYADEASDLEACRLLTDNATNLTATISQALYHTQSASIRVSMEAKKQLGLTQIAGADPIIGIHHDMSVI